MKCGIGQSGQNGQKKPPELKKFFVGPFRTGVKRGGALRVKRGSAGGQKGRHAFDPLVSKQGFKRGSALGRATPFYPPAPSFQLFWGIFDHFDCSNCTKLPFWMEEDF